MADYTFMHVGGLYDAVIQISMEAAQRFHIEKAGYVLDIACHAAADDTPESICHEIYEETGIGILPESDDFRFLQAVAQAHAEMADITNRLWEVSGGK